MNKIKNVSYEVKKVPSIEEILKSLKPIKVKYPNKDNFINEISLGYRIKSSKYIECSDNDVIENNDIVKIESKSDDERYNGLIELVVGRDGFDIDFENELLGLKLKEEKVISINNTKSSIRVLSIVKKAYGEVDLDEIKKNQPDIKSVDEFFENEYKNKCNELEDTKLRKLVISRVCKKIIEGFDIQFNLDEISEYVEERKKVVENVIIPEGVPEHLRERFDITPKVAKFQYIGRTKSFFQYIMNNKQDEEINVSQLSDKDVDELFKKIVIKEYEYLIINREFKDLLNIEITKEQYNNYLEETAAHVKVSVEQLVSSNRGFSFENFYKMKERSIILEYVTEYAKVNLIV